jgi:hypothetical protein
MWWLMDTAKQLEKLALICILIYPYKCCSQLSLRHKVDVFEFHSEGNIFGTDFDEAVSWSAWFL